MARFPALPIWTDAYLADTIHLTPEQHGIYFLLLLHTWRAPECKIPNDDEWLAGRFRMPVEWVREKVRPMLAEFYTMHGVCMMQKRLSAEFVYVTEKKQKRVAAAKSRWNKQKGLYNASSFAHAMHMQPLPLPIIKERPAPSEEKEAQEKPPTSAAANGKAGEPSVSPQLLKSRLAQKSYDR